MRIESTDQNILITLDKNMVSIDFLTELMERLRIEYLAEKVDFSEDILEIADKIKEGGWKAIKKQFLKGIDNENRD
jgi:hypothetical protein